MEKSHQEAIDAGFSFQYTLLGSDEDVACFNLDTKSETIKVAKNEISSVGKHVNVRVELVIDKKTYAYGYLSIVIINNKQQVDITLPTLTLACNDDYTFKTSITWNEFLTALTEKAGNTFDLSKYTIDGVLNDFTQYDTADKTLADVTTLNVIGKDGDNFTWTFDVNGAKAMFYTDGEPNAPQEYVTYLDLKPLAAYPELAELIVKVTIPGVSYPMGVFEFNDCIKNYWFYDPLVGDATCNADDVADRHEIHANVEVVGQTNFNREADLFFDASKYYIWNASNVGKKVADVLGDKAATTKATGADGTEYVLFLSGERSLYLQAFAANGNVPALGAVDANGVKLVQDVVFLSGDNNKVGTFLGLDVEENTKRADQTIARNLLNAYSHDQLGPEESFTTHMIMREHEYLFAYRS